MLPDRSEPNLPVKREPENYLEALKKIHPEHDYKMTPAAEKLLSNYKRLNSIVDTTCIMTCPGAATCPWAKSGDCPLAKAGLDLPVGQACPVESLRYSDNVDSLVIGVKQSDPNGFISQLEIEIINKIAAADIQIARIQKEISGKPEATIETVVGTDSDGMPIYGMVANPSYDTLRKLEMGRNANWRQLTNLMTARQKVAKNKISDDAIMNRRKKAKEVLATIEAEFEQVETKPPEEKEQILSVADLHKKKQEEYNIKVNKKHRAILGSDGGISVPDQETN